MSTAVAVKGAEKYLKPIDTNVVETQSLPFVTFAFKMADDWDGMAGAIKGLQESNPVLKVDGEYRPLNPFRAHVVSARQIWVERDQGRDPLSVSVDAVPFESPQKEEVHAVLLVYSAGGLVPATCTFKKGACKGVKTIIDELKIVGDSTRIKDWIGKSADHKAAAAIPYPFGRFVATIKSFMKPPKGGKGKPYLITQATCQPTSAADATLLARFFAEQESIDKLNAVEALNESRLSTLVKIAA